MNKILLWTIFVICYFSSIMQQIHYELGVLAKSIHFKNLSAAATHVGLSQPQLSRIIAKIEEELKIVLLDRSAKRKSGWTSAALRVVTIFEKINKQLESDLIALSESASVSELRIGILEGLVKIGLDLIKIAFDQIGIQKITLDVFELTELESQFISGNLDLILTSKIPGKQKINHLYEIGYQSFDLIDNNPDFEIYSTFEFNHSAKKNLKTKKKILISNSLSVKKEWFHLFGGVGYVPGKVKKSKLQDDDVPVILIGSEISNPLLWNKLTVLMNRKT